MNGQPITEPQKAPRVIPSSLSFQDSMLTWRSYLLLELLQEVRFFSFDVGDASFCHGRYFTDTVKRYSKSKGL